jgi:hypothetical protein
MTLSRWLGAAALATVGLSLPAKADAIDGDWCFGSSNLAISGPDLRTPVGNQIKGDYDRHGFRYVVPVGEAGAGGEVVMRLISDESMILTRKAGGTDGAPETWRRCKPIS